MFPKSRVPVDDGRSLFWQQFHRVAFLSHAKTVARKAGIPDGQVKRAVLNLIVFALSATMHAFGARVSGPKCELSPEFRWWMLGKSCRSNSPHVANILSGNGNRSGGPSPIRLVTHSWSGTEKQTPQSCRWLLLGIPFPLVV